MQDGVVGIFHVRWNLYKVKSSNFKKVGED